MNSAKKCRPVPPESVPDGQVEISSLSDEAPPPPTAAAPPAATTNGNAATPAEEPKERRAGIQAPVVNVDENTSSVKKHAKSAE